MARSDQRTTAAIALIGMSGILGAVLSANWDKFFPEEPAEGTEVTTTPLKPLNVELMEDAWHALDKKDYHKAIELARRCVEEFETTAEARQLSLENARSPTPPTPTEIFRRGLLNDVAASHFIIGKASEALGDIDTAIDAYQKTSRYTYAFVWDERGWFWSPSKEVLGNGDRRVPDLAELLDPIP